MSSGNKNVPFLFKAKSLSNARPPTGRLVRSTENDELSGSLFIKRMKHLKLLILAFLLIFDLITLKKVSK